MVASRGVGSFSTTDGVLVKNMPFGEKSGLSSPRARDKETLKHAKKGTKRGHLLELERFASKGDLTRSQSVFNRMKAKGWHPDTHMFNQLIRSCEKDGRLRRALKLYNTMKKHGNIPDVWTLNSLINVCAEGKVPEAAQTYLDKAEWVRSVEMPKWGVKPSVETYNILMKLYLKHEKDAEHKELWALMREMKGVGLLPDETSYATWMMSLHAPGSPVDLPKVLDVWEEMKANHISPSVHAYNTLLKLCSVASTNADQRLAFEIFRDMQVDGVSPDKHTYDMLLGIALRHRRWTFGFRVYSKFFDMPNVNAANVDVRSLLDTQVCNTLIRVCGTGDPLYVEKILQQMSLHHVKRNATTYDLAVATVAKKGDALTANRLISMMEHEGFKPTIKTYTGLLMAYTILNDPVAVDGILSDVRQRNLKPDDVFNKLVRKAKGRKADDSAIAGKETSPPMHDE